MKPGIKIDSLLGSRVRGNDVGVAGVRVVVNQPVPLISILMTVFNAEWYLSASIESILQQTFTNWEFLIVDDASTDQSLTIAESYAVQDSRIRLIRNSYNKGQTPCLNQGLGEARGLWIARQDADDLSLPTRLEKQIEKVTQEPTLVLVGTSGFMIDHQDRLTGLLDLPLTQELIAWSSPMLNPFLHTAVLFQAEVVRALGGYDEKYRIAQDYDLWMRMIAAGYATANLPERLVSYRHLESSLSKLGQSRAFEEATKIAQRGEQAAFGHVLRHEERLLLIALRRGLGVAERQQFWKLFHALQTSLRKDAPVLRVDLARLTAVIHLRIAGSCSGHLFSIIQEVGAAFVRAPRFMLWWMFYRFTRRRSRKQALRCRNEK